MTARSKVLYYAFLQYLNQLRKDAMLLLLCIAPVLSGLFFYFGIPLIQNLIIEYLNIPDLLQPYYLLFDLLLTSITPLLYCFASAYIILGEIDDGISKYLAVTPIGKRGYLISRLGLPTIIAFIVTVLIVNIFHLTMLSQLKILLISLLTASLGLMEALLVVSISSNKVEGMAVSKLSGLFFLGLPAPFFITGNLQYLLFFLPTFWISKYAMEDQLIYAVAGVFISLLWIYFLYQRFEKKIM